MTFLRAISFTLAIVSAATQWPVEARAGTNPIESAVADLQYELTVVWDQNDPAFRDQVVSHFLTEVDEARAAGSSDAELIAALAGSALDSRTAQDIRALAEVAKTAHYSSPRIVDQVAEIAMRNEKTGANWSGGAKSAAIGIVVVGVVVVALVCLTSASSSSSSASSNSPSIESKSVTSVVGSGLMGPQMSLRDSGGGSMGPRMSSN